MKRELRAWFDEVLAFIDVARVMRAPGFAKGLSRLGQRPLLVIALGKAARSMAECTLELLPGCHMRGLVVPPETDAAPLPPFEVIAGGHPLPTVGSMRAARRALELARSVKASEDLLFLISGGGSAMLELPGDDGVSLAELRTLYQSLIACGADIDEINTVRCHLSAVKGGRLALAGVAAHRHQTLAVYDVPLASGALASRPNMFVHSSADDCRAVLDRHDLWRAVPPSLRKRLEQNDLLPHWAPDHELGTRSEVYRILDERDSARAATTAAKRAGYVVAGGPAGEPSAIDVDNWPYEQAAEHLLQRLDELHRQHPGKRVAIVTTGELSVPLPPEPGIGGRNLQFALYCATRIQGSTITVLSCGTDGIDGNSPAAGAVVDGTTVARATNLGLDARDHLLRCDAYTLLEALGDCLKPGPTGTNVRDLRVLVREA